MKKTIKILTLATVLGLAVTLTACGKSTNSSNGKTYQVAVSTASKPLSYKENGKLKGYEVEVLRAVDKKVKDANFNITAVSQTAELVGLDSKKYDFAANGFYSNPERAKKYHIGKQNDGLSLVKVYSNKNVTKSAITDLDDLQKLTLAPVNANGGMYNLLTQWNKDNTDKQIKVTTTDGLPMQQLLQGVNSGKYDALIDPSNLGEAEIIKKLNLSNVTTSQPVRAFPTYFLYPEMSN